MPRMDYVYRSDRSEKMYISELHKDLGSVEMCHCPAEQSLEMDALHSDGMISNITVYYLEAIPQAGKFIDFIFEGESYTLCEADISKLYYVDKDFVVKRNYHYDPEFGKKQYAKQTLFGASSDLPYEKVFYGNANQEKHDTPSRSGTAKKTTWADLEMDSLDDLIAKSGTIGIMGTMRQQLPSVKFLRQDFLDSLPTQGQVLVNHERITSKPGFFDRKYFSFDIIGMFVDSTKIYVRNPPKIMVLMGILGAVDRYERDGNPGPILADEDLSNELTAEVKALICMFTSEQQRCLMRTLVFFSLRKFVTSERIERSNLGDRLKSFFMGDEATKYCLRTMSLSKASFVNNKKILIDEYYASHCISDTNAVLLHE